MTHRMKQKRDTANALGRELVITVREQAKVPAHTVFDTLVDLSGHLSWGGAEASTLLSIEAPSGPATVGTEFTSSAEDAMCRMRDSSVVTEASRPTTFERVTESALEHKRSGKSAKWVVVHRYEIAPDGNLCAVSYTGRIVRATALPGALAVLGIPWLRAIAAWEWTRASKAGVRRLIVAAEDSGKR